MTHELATASLHDGGGIFTLAWSLLAIPSGVALILNYRGTAEQMHHGGGRPVSPLVARIFGGVMLAGGLIAVSLAIHRFAQGGY